MEAAVAVHTKGFGVVVVGLQVALDGGDQIGNGTKHGAAERLVGELTTDLLRRVLVSPTKVDGVRQVRRPPQSPS
jgi:hypothetical protein